ncbi:MAG: type II toxin-antitoxin system RelE/ParE family toxin [Rivularia sp. T60_A2020_040]|nr:type II toxin-antitoxin system RelE/ParE family toxin [Rivularia sp. T60_A2020_040]
MSYDIQFSKSASKQIKKLSSEVQERIQTKIDNLAIEPRPDGIKKLKGRENAYRIRVGDYRIIYDIFDEVLLITVVEVGHRSNIYQNKS